MYIDFKKIFSDIKNGRYRLLGSGSGRHVYDIGDGCVAKLARNSFGIFENKNEYNIYMMDRGELLAKVYSVSEGYQILLMQTANTVGAMSPIMNYFNVRTKKEFFNIPKLKALTQKHNLVMRELLRPKNWGLVRGRPVIIDYGFISRR